MELIPSAFHILATCGVVGGVYGHVTFFSPFGVSSSSEPVTVEAVSEEPWGRTLKSHSVEQKKLSENGPILSCEEHGKYYEVHLAIFQAGGGEQKWEKNSASDLLTFKVLDVKDQQEVVWGPGVRLDNKWTNWTIRFSEKEEVKLGVPYQGGNYISSNYQAIKCQVNKIDKTVVGTGREVTVAAVKGHEHKANVLQLKIDPDKCTPKNSDSQNITECDISFASEINLKWVIDFSPKAIFQTAGGK